MKRGGNRNAPTLTGTHPGAGRPWVEANRPKAGAGFMPEPERTLEPPISRTGDRDGVPTPTPAQRGNGSVGQRFQIRLADHPACNPVESAALQATQNRRQERGNHPVLLAPSRMWSITRERE